MKFDVHLPEVNFVGRLAELQLLDEALQRNIDSANDVESLVSAVSGLGGIGKTQLVRQYVFENSGKYDDNIIWINAQSEDTIADSFKRLALFTLNITTFGANGEEKDIISIVRDVCRYFSQEKCLFIYDNVESIKSINKFLVEMASSMRSSYPNFRPYILTTSRLQIMNAKIKGIELGVWQLDEASEFVSKMLGDTEEEQEDVYLLVDKLHYFPLALRQAAAYINFQRERNGRKFTLSHYIGKFNEQVKELLDFGPPDDAINIYTQTTFTTWSITIKAIEEEKTYGRLAIKILNVIAYFAPENIHRESLIDLTVEDKSNVLALASSTFGKLFIQSTVKTLLNLDVPSKQKPIPKQSFHDREILLESAVHLLVKYSMINKQDGECVISVHRIVQEVIRATLVEKHLEKLVLRDALKLMEKLMKRIAHTDHATSVYEYSLKYHELAKEFGNLGNVILVNLITVRKFERAIVLGNSILNVFKTIFDHNGSMIENIESNLRLASAFYHDSWLITAAEYKIYDQMLKIREKEFGEDDADTVALQYIIGYILCLMGRYSDSIKLLEEIHKKQLLTLGTHHASTLESEFQIAIVYYQQSSHKEALQRLIALDEKQRSVDGCANDGVWFHIAMTLSYFQISKTALKIFEQIYERWQIDLGYNSRHTLSVRNRIAETYKDLGMYEESLAIYTEVHRISIETYGDNSITNLHAITGIADIYFLQGKYIDAQRYYLNVMTNRLIIEDKHPIFIDLALKIEHVLLQFRNYDQSIEMNKLVGEFAHERFGENNTKSVLPLINSGVALFRKEEYQDALRIFKDVCNKRMDLGELHPYIQLARHNIACIYMRLTEYSKSLEILLDVYAKTVKIYDDNHSTTLNVLNNIAAVLLHMEKLDDAEIILEEIFKNKMKLGDGNETIFETKKTMAFLYFKQKKYTESLEMYREIYEREVTMFSSDHPHILRILNMIAIVLSIKGDSKEALSILEKVFEHRMKLGDDHQVIKTATQFSNFIHIEEREKLLQYYNDFQTRIRKDLDEETLNVFNETAHSLLLQGEYIDALPILEEVCKYESELGGKHSIILLARQNIAFEYGKLGDYSKSLEIYKDVYEKNVSRFGEIHPNALNIQNGVAEILIMSGEQYGEAFMFLLRVYRSKTEIGDEHPVIQIARENIACIYLKAAMYDKSLEMYMESYAIVKNQLSESHPDTLKQLLGIAISLFGQKEYNEALPIFQSIYSYEMELGEENTIIITALELLAATYFQLNMYQEALELFRKAYRIEVKLFGEEHTKTQLQLTYIADSIVLGLLASK